MKDYYLVLGLTSQASGEQIKKAYKLLAVKYHPDTASDENQDKVQAKFQELQEAYEIIGDAEKRLTYDETRSKALVTDIQQDAANVVLEYFNQLRKNP